jgi:hypothetical protein
VPRRFVLPVIKINIKFQGGPLSDRIKRESSPAHRLSKFPQFINKTMLRASVKKFVCKLVQKRAAVLGNRALSLSQPARFFGQKVVKLLRKVYINFLLLLLRAGEIRLQALLLLFTHQLESLDG